MVRLIPRRQRTRILLVAAALVVVAILANRPDEATAPASDTPGAAATRSVRAPATTATVAAPMPSAPVGEGRTFALALGVTPPTLTLESILEVVARMPDLAEYALIQRDPPWPQLLAGQTPDEIIDAEYRDLVATLRDLGLGIILLVDPLDGLDRRREPESLVSAGRSILEPEIVALHERWVLALAARLQPDYLGLASEINTPAAHGRSDLYEAIRDMTNRLAPELRRLSPVSRLFVTFQVDDAWGRFPGTDPSVDQFALIDEFDVDLIGLSSYPVFYFDSPADIPDDYYRRFAESAGGRPLGQFEGGWSSAPMPNGRPGSPDLQAEWVRRVEQLLDGVDALLWAHLMLTDLDLSSWGLAPDRAATLSLFATMGLTDTSFAPKPAYAEWQRIHERPLIAPP